MHEGLTPDPSMGSHFFHELVEMGILYLAVFPDRDGHRVDETGFDKVDNRLTDLVPEAAPWTAIVTVFEPARCQPPQERQLLADTMQQLVCLRCLE